MTPLSDLADRIAIRFPRLKSALCDAVCSFFARRILDQYDNVVIDPDDIAASPNLVQVATGTITNAEFKALRATPKTLVPAPGAGKMLEFVRLQLFFDYNTAYTESADNLAVRMTDGTGGIVSQAIEATGFVDATADTVTNGLPKIDAIIAKSGSENKALVLHNTGDGEYGGGNVANAVRFVCHYRTHATGF